MKNFISFLLLLFLVLSVAWPVQAAILPSHLLTPCDPASTDINKGGAGCGLDDAILSIKNIITWISIIIIPIAALMIAWGGVIIMTSTGNPGRTAKGRSAIIIAITGVVIVLMSYLIVQAVFIGVGASSYFPG